MREPIFRESDRHDHPVWLAVASMATQGGVQQFLVGQHGTDSAGFGTRRRTGMLSHTERVIASGVSHTKFETGPTLRGSPRIESTQEEGWRILGGKVGTQRVGRTFDFDIVYNITLFPNPLVCIYCDLTNSLFLTTYRSTYSSTDMASSFLGFWPSSTSSWTF